MKIKLYSCGTERPVSEIPLSLGYLKANVARAEIEIVKNRKALTDCDLIGLSATASDIKEAVNIVTNTKIPVVIGGQATLWQGLSEFPFAHIVIGDGEPALQAIVDGDTSKVFVSTGKLLLNTLQFPERGKIYRNKAPMFSSRGCPFNCAFCSSHKYWNKVRYVSAEYFMNEVTWLLSRYGTQLRSLYIMDDLFIGNVKRFYEIHALWMKAGHDKRLHLWSFIRASIFTKDIALKMKEMGFSTVRFGAESGSDKMLKLLEKKSTVAINQRAIDIARACGLKVTCSFMRGMPGETLEDRKLTLAFIRKNRSKMRVSGNYKFCAFPGTKFYTGKNPMTERMTVRR